MPIPVLSKRFTVTQAAAAAQRHPKTIQSALAAGDLHGTQRVRGGKWSVRDECLDAWIDGIPCVHRSNVVQLGRTG